VRLSSARWPARWIGHTGGGGEMQTAQPRDFGLLLLVIGLFVILLVVTVVVPGSPQLR